jgi:DNA excision repair protein ERCC-6
VQAQADPKHDEEQGTTANGNERSDAGAPESDAQAKLHQKLRSVQLEIDAVASTIKRAKQSAGKQVDGSDSGDAKDKKQQKQKHADHITQDDPHGGALQQALAAERLKSLKKAKAQIQKEISQSDPCPSGSDKRKDKMLAMLVEEEPKRKKKTLMPSRGPKKMSTPRLKTMTYNDDDDFDAVLDGASAGFMETVSC